MKALLLSAYGAASHRYWARGVMAHLPAIDWTLLELPARHFHWQIRANPLLWLEQSGEALAQEYELIVATSMVDLATLIGLRPHLGRAHKVVYFHENQFVYPMDSQRSFRPEPRMVNLYAALAADRVLFNSHYNRDSFFTGARRFLGRMPGRLSLQTLENVRQRSAVLPVPLHDTISPPSAGSPRRLIWNHRWEYDKDPETFFQVCLELSRQGVDFELVVMGQQFRQSPAIFEQARRRLAEHIVCWGAQPSERYLAWLSEGGIAVSTARHEFQGLAVMEAVQRGCLPLVPERLCYPEFYPSVYRHAGSVEALTDRLVQWLTYPARRPERLDASGWCWSALLPHYQYWLVSCRSSADGN